MRPKKFSLSSLLGDTQALNELRAALDYAAHDLSVPAQ